MHDWWPWLILFLLGCFHGINPGMGWLFAVALGMQEKSTRAVLGAVFPIGLGHAVSIGLIVAIATKVTGSTIAGLDDTCGNLIQIAALDRWGT